MTRHWFKLSDENERIADLLVGLTQVHRTWGFGLCFLYLSNVKGHSWNHMECKKASRRQRQLRHRVNTEPPDHTDHSTVCCHLHRP